MKTSIKESLEKVAESIDEHWSQGNHSVNVFSMPARMPIVNQFVLLFVDALLQSVDDYDLSKNDMRVLLYIVKQMRFGNLIRLSWADVARALDIPTKNISRHIGKLREAKLIIEDEQGTFLNPQVIAKGKFLSRNEDEDAEYIQMLERGAQELESIGREPNILTPRLQRKRREAKREKADARRRRKTMETEEE